MSLTSLAITVAVAVISVALGWVFSRHYGNRRRDLLVSCRYVPLVPRIADLGADLTVLWQETRLDSPGLISVLWINYGPGDIRPDEFSGGEATLFYPGVHVVAELRHTPNGARFSRGDIDHDGTAFASIRLEPDLMPVGEPFYCLFLVDGTPSGTPTIRTRIANVRGLERPPRRSMRPMDVAALTLVGLGVITLVGFARSALSGVQDPSLESGSWLVPLGATLCGIGLLLVIPSFRRGLSGLPSRAEGGTSGLSRVLAWAGLVPGSDTPDDDLLI